MIRFFLDNPKTADHFPGPLYRKIKMKEYSLVFMGFGNVGQALARLLIRKQAALADQYGISFKTVGIATGRHGQAIDAAGIPLSAALECLERGKPLDRLSAMPPPTDGIDFIRACPADILFENTPTNHTDGQPAIAYLRTALESGMHAITANKGPVVHAYQPLRDLADAQGRRFLFESAVMDGAPIFSLFRGALPAVDLRGFRGILNSTTNLILEHMEQGESLEEATRYAQQIGIAETDPSADVDGWDAAIKVAALATVLMNRPTLPQDVKREGIRSLDGSQVAAARSKNCRLKLVCEARLENGRLNASVAPRLVDSTSPLFSVCGTSSYIEFELDSLPGLGILESNPGPETTAYGLLADMINAARGM